MRERARGFLDEQLALIRFAIKWAVLALIVGVIAGALVAVFIIILKQVNAWRNAIPVVILFIPAAGYALGWVQQRFAANTIAGPNIILDVENNPEDKSKHIPLLLIPVAFVGTLWSQFFGASTASVGAAFQMAASIADNIGFRLGPRERRALLLTGVSAGFAAAVGAPAAGALFGLEVRRAGAVRYDGILPALVAGFTAHTVAVALGMTYTQFAPTIRPEFELFTAAKFVIAGVAFGWTALLYIEATKFVRATLQKRFPGSLAIRMAIGGVGIVAITLLVGNTYYNGLSSELVQAAGNGQQVPDFSFLIKLILTAVSVGAGFIGGDVTPIFVMGAVAGANIAPGLGLPIPLMAGLGYTAVFAGALNVPITAIILGVELYGGENIDYIVIVCFVAYLATGMRSVFARQRLDTPKLTESDEQRAARELEENSPPVEQISSSDGRQI